MSVDFTPVPNDELKEMLEFLESGEADEFTVGSWALPENLANLIAEVVFLRSHLLKKKS